jgi:hypothetical protein
MLLLITVEAQPLSPVRIYGSLQFNFYGNNVLQIENVTIYTNLFSKLYVKNPMSLKACEGSQNCQLYFEGLINFYPSLGSTQKFMTVKFKVLTTVPPQYSALRKLLGPAADELFVMCVLIPRPELAAKTVAGSVARFLAYNMRTFYFFAVAPYNIWLKPGETVTLTYFISTSPTDVSLFARRMMGSQPCPWGSIYYAQIPTVLNFGGITGIKMQWGWAIPNAIKPAGYWDYPKAVYYTFTVSGAATYPQQGTYTSNRGPSGLITVPPMTVSVSTYAYPASVFTFKLPGSYVGAVMQSFEVSFARRCPGDVDLDGRYTMNDFNVLGCMSGLITNTTFCNNLLNHMPPILKNLFTLTGDVDGNGVINANDALIVLSYVGKTCPAATYAKYFAR